jgi:hypothetical protein
MKFLLDFERSFIDFSIFQFRVEVEINCNLNFNGKPSKNIFSYCLQSTIEKLLCLEEPWINKPKQIKLTDPLHVALAAFKSHPLQKGFLRD